MKKGQGNIVDSEDPLKSAVQSMGCEMSGNIGKLWEIMQVAGVDCGACINCRGTTDLSLEKNCKRSSSVVKSVGDDVL